MLGRGARTGGVGLCSKRLVLMTVEKRVAITLWCLAIPCEYRTQAHLFGVARSTVCTTVHETCEAIILTLMKTYIKFPSGEELKKVVDGCEGRWGFPQCVGAIDVLYQFQNSTTQTTTTGSYRGSQLPLP